MIFLALFIAANLFMAVIAWRAYGRLLAGRGRRFSWSFQNTVNLFLVWTLVTGCFEIAYMHSHDFAVFCAFAAQLVAFLALVKVGTMDYACCRRRTGTPAESQA